mmetsp:Transcript_15858/g.37444  ORF Transcript_15858/g.37444 Transcript_15858/m.37444 type:complete len:233 (-) Transcript_15858:400-1098(-)
MPAAGGTHCHRPFLLGMPPSPGRRRLFGSRSMSTTGQSAQDPGPHRLPKTPERQTSFGERLWQLNQGRLGHQHPSRPLPPNPCRCRALAFRSSCSSHRCLKTRQSHLPDHCRSSCSVQTAVQLSTQCLRLRWRAAAEAGTSTIPAVPTTAAMPTIAALVTTTTAAMPTVTAVMPPTIAAVNPTAAMIPTTAAVMPTTAAVMPITGMERGLPERGSTMTSMIRVFRKHPPLQH